MNIQARIIRRSHYGIRIIMSRKIWAGSIMSGQLWAEYYERKNMRGYPYEHGNFKSMDNFEHRILWAQTNEYFQS